MKQWFLDDGGESFVLFGTNHFILLALYLIGFFLLIYFKKTIQTNESVAKIIRWTLFSLLISLEGIYQIWGAIQGTWAYHLPFHLCGIAGIVGALALWTQHRKLIAASFFLCLIPALLALITPDLLYDFPSFRFLKFFIHHIIISWTGLFLAVYSTRKVITWKSMFETYVYLVLYAFFVGLIVNPLLDANYLYLSHAPIRGTTLDLFGTGFWYRINLGIVALLVFSLQCMVYRLLTKKLQDDE